MKFDWSEYLTLAHEILGKRKAIPYPTDARKRAAISRAYYAAFIITRNYFRKKGKDIPKNGSGHSYVRRLLENDPDKQVKKMGEKIKRLAKYRTKADYEDEFDGNLDKATEAALRFSTHIVQKFQE